MFTLKPLTSRICSAFSMHPSRRKTLAALIYGVMDSSNVQHISLSRYLSTPQPKNALRRIERFFQHQSLKCSDAALAMVSLLKFTGNFDLCLDRTNWKFGQKNINYLVLSWRVNSQIFLPLLAVELSKQFRNVLFWQFRNVRFRGGVIHKSIAHSRPLTARDIWSCGPCG